MTRVGRDELLNLPGVGPSIARDLRDLGVGSVAALARRDPERLYIALERLRGGRQDPCVLYTFRCAVYAARTANPKPELLKWWHWKDRVLPSRRRPSRWSACLALALAGSSVTAAPAQSVPPESTVVVLLGTGTPGPNPDAFGPATAVVVGRRVFLFDAGVGVMMHMSAAGLPISGPEALFLTHLHSDHTLGYPDVIFTSWLMRRRGALPAFGPPGLQRMTDHLMAAWEKDIAVRTTDLEHERAEGLAVAVHEIGPGVVYDSGGVRVTAIPVEHGAWAVAYGYRIDTPDRVIVLSGDTRPSEALARAAEGADVLIHEVYPAGRLAPEDRPGGGDWPRYMRAYHTSDVEVGALAARARPRLLILHHIVRMGGTDEELLAGVRRGGFTGRAVIGKDLERY